MHRVLKRYVLSLCVVDRASWVIPKRWRLVLPSLSSLIRKGMSCLCAYLYSAGKFSETTELVCPMHMYGDDQIAIHIDAYVPLGIAGKPIDVTQLASHI
jgi:hypothetical protein